MSFSRLLRLFSFAIGLCSLQHEQMSYKLLYGLQIHMQDFWIKPATKPNVFLWFFFYPVFAQL